MKKFTTLVPVGILLLSFAILFTNCKKKTDDDPVVPAFSVTATTVMLKVAVMAFNSMRNVQMLTLK